MKQLLAPLLVALALAGCTSTGDDLPDATPATSTTTTTAAPGGAAAPDCGNPVASYAPSGPLPSPGAENEQVRTAP